MLLHTVTTSTQVPLCPHQRSWVGVHLRALSRPIHTVFTTSLVVPIHLCVSLYTTTNTTYNCRHSFNTSCEPVYSITTNTHNCAHWAPSLPYNKFLNTAFTAQGRCATTLLPTN
uniref:Uncharacterized protein n=1 Tax=Lygus hesperus TaxID=30085 RepID=A0A146MEH0_LYGHE